MFRGVLICVAMFIIVASAFARSIKKVFSADAAIVASPVVLEDKLVVTSADSCCYLLNLSDFSLIWKYKSKSPIRSSALVQDSYIYLETGNAITCLNLSDGRLKWKSPENTCTRTTDMDQWDYHRSAPVLYNDVLYAGDDFGWIYGTNLDGERIFEHHIGAFSPVRSDMKVINGLLYFGDWEGTLYAYDLYADSMAFTLPTVEVAPSENYGAIITPVVAGEEVACWGARNSTLLGFDYNSQLVRWRYTDESEAWISGTPVFDDDELYIGSSDSRTLYCFTANSGSLKWKTSIDQNIFSAPLVLKKDVVVCDGNAYEEGYGIIYFLDKEDGEILDRLSIKGSIFCTPVELKKSILVGNQLGGLYVISKK